MEIKELKKRPSIDQNKKLVSAYAQFDKLLTELKKKGTSRRNCKVY
jgi:hypothetical protein